MSAKKSQIQKFREAARAAETDLTEGRFNAALKAVAKQKPAPAPKAPAKRKKRNG